MASVIAVLVLIGIFCALYWALMAGHGLAPKVSIRRRPKPKKERLMFDWEIRAIERECGIGLDEPGYQPSPEVVAILNEDPVYAGSLPEPHPLPVDAEAPDAWSGRIEFADPHTTTRLNALFGCEVVVPDQTRKERA